MRYVELFEQSRAPLYHSMELEHAFTALKKNKLEPRTGQRVWSDGIRRTDDDPLYNESMWVKGWSMTRDIEYAKSWKGMFFVMDQDKINQNFKILPYSWGSSISTSTNIKKEREEFVVSYLDKRTEQDYYRDWEKKQDEDDPEVRNLSKIDYMWQPRKGSKNIEPLQKYSDGFYVGISYLDEGDRLRRKIPLFHHPLYRGVYKVKGFKLKPNEEIKTQENIEFVLKKYGGEKV